MGSSDSKSHLMQESSAQDSSANHCLEFSKILLADTEMPALRSLSRRGLSNPTQGMWLADNLQLLVLSGSASTFELRWVFSGSLQPMAEQGSSLKAWPLLTNMGLLEWAISVLALHIGLADLVQSASKSECSPANLAFSPFPSPGVTPQ